MGAQSLENGVELRASCPPITPQTADEGLSPLVLAWPAAACSSASSSRNQPCLALIIDATATSPCREAGQRWHIPQERDRPQGWIAEDSPPRPMAFSVSLSRSVSCTPVTSRDEGQHGGEECRVALSRARFRRPYSTFHGRTTHHNCHDGTGGPVACHRDREQPRRRLSSSLPESCGPSCAGRCRLCHFCWGWKRMGGLTGHEVPLPTLSLTRALSRLRPKGPCLPDRCGWERNERA